MQEHEFSRIERAPAYRLVYDAMEREILAGRLREILIGLHQHAAVARVGAVPEQEVCDRRGEHGDEHPVAALRRRSAVRNIAGRVVMRACHSAELAT